MPDLLRIGELAAAAGVSSRTVDFYTSLGLIAPAGRTRGGFRLYHPGAAELIAGIRQLEASGMALEAIGHDLARASATDLAQVVAQIDRDLQMLQAAAVVVGPAAQHMATALVVRANCLITLAMELLAALPQV